MTDQPESKDIPVEVKGYQTDPLRRGYQILWNYESTFWRGLVGNDAWGLYEVLRSFCHEKNPICNPSINLLLAILAVEDRRVLTGRIKQVKEKEYKYPGLIDILQTHGLAIAEAKGEGPEMRYIFHVNLTPELLTAEQLAKLPPTLQQKHKELLERCEQAKKELEAKKKPSKVQNDNQGGMGNSQGGVWEIPTPPVGISHSNITHRTLPIKQNKQQSPTTKDKNNNSGGGKQDVVVALTRLGITEKVAQRLASRHKEAAINQQIDYHEYELETNPQKIKSPSGRLRTRIEENWAAPDGYTPDWRERQSAEKQQQEARQEAIEARQQQQVEEDQHRQEAALQKRLAALQAYQPPPEMTELWEGITTQIEARSHDLNSKLLAECLLVQVDGTTATIWTPNKFIAQQLEQHLGLAIRKQLARHLKANLSDIQAVFVTSTGDKDSP